jgi:hypothetical protein
MMEAFNVEIFDDEEPLQVEMQNEDVIILPGEDNEKAVPCTPTDWQLSDGYYTLTIPAAVHTRGPAVRCTGAESGGGEDESRDAVISWRRLTNGTVLIYSDIPFAGRIFVKG